MALAGSGPPASASPRHRKKPLALPVHPVYGVGMEKPMAITTCTVRTATGGTCGQPAEATGTSRTGFAWAECAEHAADAGSMASAKPASDGSVKVGDRVGVTHIGIDKVGTVTKVGRVGVLVDVPIHGGEARKVIRRRFDEITR